MISYIVSQLTAPLHLQNIFKNRIVHFFPPVALTGCMTPWGFLEIETSALSFSNAFIPLYLDECHLPTCRPPGAAGHL